MSAELYPSWVWERFGQPQWVLVDDARAVEVGRTRTPASAEVAVLYRGSAGQWFWRAHASPWLVAVLEVLCTQLNAAASPEAVVAALNNLNLPPVKRYCRVMADELWQASAQA